MSSIICLVCTKSRFAMFHILVNSANPRAAHTTTTTQQSFCARRSKCVNHESYLCSSFMHLTSGMTRRPTAGHGKSTTRYDKATTRHHAVRRGIWHTETAGGLSCGLALSNTPCWSLVGRRLLSSEYRPLHGHSRPLHGHSRPLHGHSRCSAEIRRAAVSALLPVITGRTILQPACNLQGLANHERRPQSGVSTKQSSFSAQSDNRR